MCSSDEDFWLTNPLDIARTPNLIATKDMTLEAQMNAFTRLVIAVFFILLFSDSKVSVPFLLVSLLSIIGLFFLHRKMNPVKEGFKSTRELYGAMPVVRGSGTYMTCTQEAGKASGALAPMKVPNSNLSLIDNTINPYTASIPIRENDMGYIYPSQRLALGGRKKEDACHPSTKIAPVIVTPSHDLDYWRDNNLINHSAVNKLSQRDAYLSGYAVTTFCKKNYTSPICCPKTQREEREEAIAEAGKQTAKVAEKGAVEYAEREFYSRAGGARSEAERYSSAERAGNARGEAETYVPDDRCMYELAGWVNTACGYNPTQLDKANLPVNVPAGNCFQSERMAEFNKNLFTQTIQPGVYFKNNVNEAINSNIGISFDQQFEPKTCNVSEDGLTYTLNDPYQVPQEVNTPVPGMDVRYDTVYDPRFNGYGTSYRSYIDPVTGQPRFAYDDINAVRMPNYVVRSKVDTIPGMDSYNTLSESDANGNPNTSAMREIVNDQWLKDSIGFRNDMTERLMRKRNSEMWQTRVSPKQGGRR